MHRFMYLIFKLQEVERCYLRVEQSFSCIGAKSLSVWELVSFPNFTELIRIIRINSVIQYLRQVTLYIWLHSQFIH